MITMAANQIGKKINSIKKNQITINEIITTFKTVIGK